MVDEMPEASRVDILETQLMRLENYADTIADCSKEADMATAVVVDMHTELLKLHDESITRLQSAVLALIVNRQTEALDALRGGTKAELNGAQEGH